MATEPKLCQYRLDEDEPLLAGTCAFCVQYAGVEGAGWCSAKPKPVAKPYTPGELVLFEWHDHEGWYALMPGAADREPLDMARIAATAEALEEAEEAYREDTTLLRQLLDVLGRECGKTGVSEGAVDVAERLIAERDLLREAHLAVAARALKAEAERDEAREALASAVEHLDEFGSCQTLNDGINAMRHRLIEARKEGDEAWRCIGHIESALGYSGTRPAMETAAAVKELLERRLLAYADERAKVIELRRALQGIFAAADAPGELVGPVLRAIEEARAALKETE